MEEPLRPNCPQTDPANDGNSTVTGATRTVAAGRNAPADHASRTLPESIGRYRVRRVIGEGGMGTVFEAEQRNPQRTVALKVIKTNVATPQMLRRFELEGEALARLQHPGIAQIYESGSSDSPSGPLPYFAMEYVTGLPLNIYAAQHRLDTRARLDLMARICDAVHHAHQRGIIHRDLKPGNILVDGSGQPKILDFGVARFTDSDALATRQTDLGQLIGTLAYMSPEQALGNPLEIDIRSDVYTLGVILYEMLAGRLPYESKRGGVVEVVRTIREDEPTSLVTINRSYRGDVATLCAKALEKDKARRYASAADLAADIRRHLADQPILAQPPTLGYQLGKFARRHRALVGAVVAVILVLIAGVVVSLQEATRARAAERSAVGQRNRATAAEQQALAERDRASEAQQQARTERDHAVSAEGRAEAGRTLAESQRRRADAEAATAKATSEFLERDLLGQASTDNQSEPDPDLKVRTALDRAAAAIAGKFANQPEVEASLRLTIGKTYEQLTLYPEAQPHLERALELRRKLFGREDVRTIDALAELAGLNNSREKIPEAVRLYEEVVALLRRVSGAESPETLRNMDALAGAYGNLGHLNDDKVFIDRARAMEREIYDVRRRSLPPEDPDRLRSALEITRILRDDRKYDEALPGVQEGLAIARKAFGPDHPHALVWEGDLAGLYAGLKRYAEAEKVLERILAVQRHIYPPGHNAVLRTLMNTAELYFIERKDDKAEAMWREAAESGRQRFGLSNTLTILAYGRLASLYGIQNHWEKAEPLYAELLEPVRVKYDGKSDYTFIIQQLGISRFNQGKYQEAEANFRTAVETGRSVFGPEGPYTLGLTIWLSNTLRMQSRLKEAEILAEALAAMRRKYKDDVPDRLTAEDSMARLYREEGRFSEAEPLAAEVLAVRRRSGDKVPIVRALDLLATISWQEGKFAEGEALARESVDSYRAQKLDTWVLYQAKALLGASLAGLRRFEEAEPLLLEGYSGIEARKSGISAVAYNRLIRPAKALAEMYRAWGKPEKAAEWEKK